MDILKSNGIYNSSLETSIRLGKLLVEFFPERISIERLIYIDFIIVNLNDFIEGEDSLHPAVPRRDTQAIIKRKLVNDAIDLMKSHGLIEEVYDTTGFTYLASDKTFSFTNSIRSTYIDKLLNNIKVIKKHYGNKSDNYLESIIRKKIGQLDVEVVIG